MAHVSATKHLTGEHALDMRRAVYKDGKVDAAELDSLFALDEAAKRRDAAWVNLFTEAVVDYLVHQQEPHGVIDETNAKWLIDRISRDGMVKTDSELEALIKVLEAAKSSPESLSAFALQQVRTAVVSGKGPVAEHRKLMVEDREDGPMKMSVDPASLGGALTPGRVGAAEVGLIRRVLYAYGGSGNIAVSRAEAEVLFDINDATKDADNDPAWTDLFTKALANTVMAASGYSVPTREVALKQEDWISGGASAIGDFFSRVVKDGFGQTLHHYQYPTDEAWQNRNAKLEKAVHDTEIIDGGEAEWLAERIQRDGVINEHEIALLRFIAEESPEIHPSLKPLIDKVA